MNAPQRHAITLSDADFQRFRDFFYRRTGIQFEDSKRYFVDTRLMDRMSATGHADFRSYFALLHGRTGGSELQFLVNAMTVNETYFFRETYQFDCMVNSLLDEIVDLRPAGHRIRIWSIPSSTGEEPYSIAIYLLERWPGIHRHDVEILSSDIDTSVLAAAERGVYSPRAVSELPAPYRNKYFKRNDHGEFVISRELVDAVSFSHVNLIDSEDTRRFRDIDLVFCRNLLIYFDDVSRRLAVDAIYDALGPGGFVCLGHSESMSRISALFHVRRLADALVYQKPMEGGGA